MNKCSFLINLFPHLTMTALLNTVVCSKISLVNESADFSKSVGWLCLIGPANFVTVKTIFFYWCVQISYIGGHSSYLSYDCSGRVIFVRWEIPVNLHQYWAAIGVFNNRNLIINKKIFYFRESNSVGINLLFISAINVMVFLLHVYCFCEPKKLKNYYLF